MKNLKWFGVLAVVAGIAIQSPVQASGEGADKLAAGELGQKTGASLNATPAAAAAAVVPAAVASAAAAASPGSRGISGSRWSRLSASSLCRC